MQVSYTVPTAGDKFGNWTLVEPAPRRHGMSRWRCLCACGTERDLDESRLCKGFTKSCGCLAPVLVSAYQQNKDAFPKRPRPPLVFTAKHAARLASRLAIQGDCLVWTGPRDPKGYGMMGACGRSQVRVHRIAWQLANGPIPEGLCVCHRCDNPPCCKVEHLFLGTVADNNWDRVHKGRHHRTAPRGEDQWLARLTEEQVRAIRRSHAEGVQQKELAARYGVCPANIRLIVRRLSWRHVTDAQERG